MKKQIKIAKKIWKTLRKLNISEAEAIAQIEKNHDDSDGHKDFVIEVIKDYYRSNGMGKTIK